MRKPDISGIATSMMNEAWRAYAPAINRRIESALTAMWLDGVRFGRTGASTASELAPKPKPKVKRAARGRSIT